ncbi:hypothetical protein ASG52_20060 [Methylobacterium sp. Leaf456]|uniref:hypothetical protein n=1 Tax=Methylobacterium sp. Leaf456 TaxID=1736382 RepID=UPI000700B031|nr:hypothetical protein [Methylobacterium sp. Leaf456]KQT59684.1 hypothetical protein ASG52_20060 [Methylobacterium sp. Leaf456]
MSPPAILIIIPTTAGPLRLRALTPRPGLPASAAFADGDYRPLPWSADYARLCAAGGPLARLVGREIGPHELRLSGSFDAGRSWEVPVGLAHALAARGHRLVAEPAEADLILWATGAVDLDLAVLPGDYALLDKIERTRALLAEAPQARIAILLPEGPERTQAEAAFVALGRPVAPTMLPGTRLAAAIAALTSPEEPARPIATETAAPPRRLRRFALPAGVLAATGVVAALALAPRPIPSAGTGEPAFTASTPHAIRVEELRAPAGSSCRRVAFGADPPERRPVPVESGDRLAPTRLVPELCGIAVRAESPGLTVEVGPELRAAALPAVRLADGAQGYFLREGGRQNLVYAVQAVSEAGAASGPRLVHALTR